MAGTNYAVLYEVSTGYVVGMWVRTTSDNRATMEADGKITVDSADVVCGLVADCSDLAVFTQLDPTCTMTNFECGVAEVAFDGATPDDVVERSDGSRYEDGDYEYAV